MVIYTSSAHSVVGGTTAMLNTINMAMQLGQSALDNSNTGITLNLVHTAEISYTESGNSDTDLTQLTSNGDGHMDIAHSWRDTYGADLVVILTNTDDTGGVAWLLNSFAGAPAYGFSLVCVQQASWSYTFIHEIGHNMGAHHHKLQSDQPGPNVYLNTYSAGWRFQVDSTCYVTLMSYSGGSYYPNGTRGGDHCLYSRHIFQPPGYP